MSISDVLDGSFRLYRANFKAITILTSLFVIPVNVVLAFLQRNTLGGLGFLDLMQDPPLLEAQAETTFLTTADLVGFLATAVVSLFTMPFVSGLIANVAGSSYLGRRLEWGPALRVTARWFFPLLGAYILVHLVEFGPFVGNVLLIASTAVATGSWEVPVLVSLGLLVTLPLALAAMALYLVVSPAIVLENLGPIRAMRRSWRLAWPRFWAVLLIGALSGFIASTVAQIVATPFASVALAVGYGVGWPLVALGSIVPTLITVPFIAIVSTLVYFDLRIRHEGFDLELAASDLERGQPAPQGGHGTPPRGPQPEPGLGTAPWQDYGPGR